ncbi:hypothetical protein [Pseudonocardia sediminis]|uniref:hypothetical protein n=1 Tax=Pseudonocardia sediminis TaxID=1397368 RepID=UPI00102A67F8|nr:hypothetical protein [Pseudonocardia sediminis]
MPRRSWRSRGPRSGALRLALALGLVLAPVAGCAATPDTPPQAAAPNALPKYYDSGALLAAVAARQRSDGGALTTLDGTLDGPSGRQAVTGDGAVRFDGAAVSVRFDQRVGPEGATPRTTGLVRTGGRTWVRVPGAAGRWLEVGVAEIPPADRADATLATNLAGTADPLSGVSRYADASLVSDAVDEDVDGVRTVRYTIVVDLVRASAAETDPAMRTQLTNQVSGGLTRISATVWVDADQRPVRARVRQELPGAGTLDLLAGYRSWGTPVSVDPPPAAG